MLSMFSFCSLLAVYVCVCVCVVLTHVAVLKVLPVVIVYIATVTTHLPTRHVVSWCMSHASCWCFPPGKALRRRPPY